MVVVFIFSLLLILQLNVIFVTGWRANPGTECEGFTPTCWVSHSDKEPAAHFSSPFSLDVTRSPLGESDNPFFYIYNFRKHWSHWVGEKRHFSIFSVLSVALIAFSLQKLSLKGTTVPFSHLKCLNTLLGVQIWQMSYYNKLWSTMLLLKKIINLVNYNNT